MALLYIAAGINHFVNPQWYLQIMPPYIPWHSTMVTVSGAAELILGCLLIPERTRRMAAWGIILLLIAVFPANIQMAIDWTHNGHANLWLAYARLPFQIILIRWAYLFTKKRY